MTRLIRAAASIALVVRLVRLSRSLESSRSRTSTSGRPGPARAAHDPPDQRCLLDRADRRRRRPGPGRHAEAELLAAGRTPFADARPATSCRRRSTSTIFKGEQMIAALNAAGLDLATLGNHEFDFGIDVLLQRMARSRNGSGWSRTSSTRRPASRSAAPRLTSCARSAPLKVGFIGLCSDDRRVTADRLTHLRLDRSAGRRRDVSPDAASARAPTSSSRSPT